MRQRLLSVSTVIAAMFLGACGSTPPPTLALAGTNAAPAAQGSLTVTTDPNGNSRLSITVRHLAPPQRMARGATAYVVWVAPMPDGTPQNVGVLRLDPNLTGSLETVTPLRDFELTIGVETDPAAQQPTSTPVIMRTVSRK